MSTMYQNVAECDVPDADDFETPAIEERDATYAPNRWLEGCLKPHPRVWQSFQLIFNEWPDNVDLV